MAVIVLDGLKRMYYEEEDVFYYITLMNENYEMPILPMRGGSRTISEGICRGIYRYTDTEPEADKPHVRLFGSGAILREALRAHQILAEKFGVGSTVYSVTSYKALYQDARDCERYNRLHPGEPPRVPYVQQTLGEDAGPVVAASDYVSAVPLSIAPWVGPNYSVLGTDGFGRSEARKELRRFFEVDAENIALAALVELARWDEYPQEKLAEAVTTLELDPDKPNPLTA
jgi:pyruvate dehydrogenase E1 component